MEYCKDPRADGPSINDLFFNREVRSCIMPELQREVDIDRTIIGREQFGFKIQKEPMWEVVGSFIKMKKYSYVNMFRSCNILYAFNVKYIISSMLKCVNVERFFSAKLLDCG